MGTYVYSLRKGHKEVRLEGILPIDVIPLRFAYKMSEPWPGEPGYANYQRMVGRVTAQADAAQDHHWSRVEREFGSIQDHDFYVVIGGDKDYEEGLSVFKTKVLPAQWVDTSGIPDSEYVGKLFKVGRKWVVSKECPGHRWKDTESMKGHWNLADREWYPARTCARCDHSEYLDPNMEREYRAYRAAQEMKEAA